MVWNGTELTEEGQKEFLRAIFDLFTPGRLLGQDELKSILSTAKFLYGKNAGIILLDSLMATSLLSATKTTSQKEEFKKLLDNWAANGVVVSPLLLPF
jgi:hypothetical protein